MLIYVIRLIGCKMKLTEIMNLIGVTRQVTSHAEKFISFLGGLISIYAIYLATNKLIGVAEAIYIIPSMGATAVLIFAAPHAPFSQPWNVFGGHIISALIGVTCYQMISDIHLAAAASVGVSIWVMYYARCTHPPGGATALAAVIGSSQIHDLGYMYAITPVLINTVVILVIGIVFNAIFSWRSYPSYLATLAKNKELEAMTNDSPSSPEGYPPINHEDFVYALSQVDTMVDISEESLLEIYSLATGRNNQKK